MVIVLGSVQPVFLNPSDKKACSLISKFWHDTKWALFYNM